VNYFWSIVWVIIFWTVAALCAWDTAKTVRAGKFVWRPPYSGKRMLYTQADDPWNYWAGVVAEVFAVWLFAFAGIGKVLSIWAH
jgi:hypothetical protein